MYVFDGSVEFLLFFLILKSWVGRKKKFPPQLSVSHRHCAYDSLVHFHVKVEIRSTKGVLKELIC